jgi:hypothetical protein
MKARVIVAVAVCSSLVHAAPREGRPSKADGAGERPGAARRDYSIEQAVSDRAQLNTLAFSGLAFVTGDLCSDTFLPPGKVCDFFGFQYMRDIDTGEMGHNTSFLTRIANNLLHVLTDEEKRELLDLAAEQEKPLRELAIKRFPLIKAFRRNLERDLPTGSKGLDKQAVMQYSADLHELSGSLAYRRAEVLGRIVTAFNEEQKAYLARLAFNDSRTWPELPDQLDKRGMSHDVHVAMMTYASELFSWYAGSVEADTYFCPEGHATYFGAFYMKDAPAMGRKGYSISTRLTADSGEAFLAALTDEQRGLITGLPRLNQRELQQIVQTRRAIATQLRQFMRGQTPNRDATLQLCRKYGELDGAISWNCAVRFAQVSKTLTAEQRATFMKLRDRDEYPCRGAYLYSSPIDLPEIPDTDFLFGVPGKPAATSRASGSQRVPR